VFLTELCDENDGDFLLRPARALPLDGYQEASGGDYSDDVYLCEYKYNTGFRVRAPARVHVHEACLDFMMLIMRMFCLAWQKRSRVARSSSKCKSMHSPHGTAADLCSEYRTNFATLFRRGSSSVASCTAMQKAGTALLITTSKR
jgi:hypothetical protein